MKYAHRNIITLKWQQIREWEAERYVASLTVWGKKNWRETWKSKKKNSCSSQIKPLCFFQTSITALHSRACVCVCAWPTPQSVIRGAWLRTSCSEERGTRGVTGWHTIKCAHTNEIARSVTSRKKCGWTGSRLRLWPLQKKQTEEEEGIKWGETP